MTTSTTIQPKRARCQSINHNKSECYGPLWTCSQCKKTVCCNEGTDGVDEDLCDDCWTAKHDPAYFATVERAKAAQS